MEEGLCGNSFQFLSQTLSTEVRLKAATGGSRHLCQNQTPTATSDRLLSLLEERRQLAQTDDQPQLSLPEPADENKEVRGLTRKPRIDDNVVGRIVRILHDERKLGENVDWCYSLKV